MSQNLGAKFDRLSDRFFLDHRVLMRAGSAEKSDGEGDARPVNQRDKASIDQCINGQDRVIFRQSRRARQVGRLWHFASAATPNMARKLCGDEQGFGFASHTRVGREPRPTIQRPHRAAVVFDRGRPLVLLCSAGWTSGGRIFLQALDLGERTGDRGGDFHDETCSGLMVETAAAADIQTKPLMPVTHEPFRSPLGFVCGGIHGAGPVYL
jgi:hypothetical protein